MSSNLANYKFQGWLGLDGNSVKGEMVWQEYESKPFEETDIDIKISHCGVCASDLHTLRSGWAPTAYPVCVGHEIVGIAARVRSEAEGGIKVGDRVGVGAQSKSCLRPDCEECSNNLENYCQSHQAGTYNARFKEGSKTYGGYWRGPSHFVLKIPDSLPSDSAAPLLCGAITVYSPLNQHGVGPGKNVGIVGIGGLGHFGIMSAKVFGCEQIVAISRSSSKKNDAIKMGATDFIATEEDLDWVKRHSLLLDIIVSTVSSSSMPLKDYLNLLKVGGIFVQIGAPEDDIKLSVFPLLFGKRRLVGSGIGSPKEIRDMLNLSAKKEVRTWNKNLPMAEANSAILEMDGGKARYRIVLVNERKFYVHTEQVPVE